MIAGAIALIAEAIALNVGAGEFGDCAIRPVA
jgi:hypothetical protein